MLIAVTTLWACSRINAQTDIANDGTNLFRCFRGFLGILLSIKPFYKPSLLRTTLRTCSAVRIASSTCCCVSVMPG